MKAWPLRRRVAAAAAAAIVLALAGLGVAVQLLLAHQLRTSLDETLRSRAGDIERLAASAPAVVTRPGALESTLGARSLEIEVFDRHGLLVARSLALGARLLPARPLVRAAIHGGHARYADVRFGGDPTRLFVAPLADIGGGPAAGGAVVVAASTEELEDTLERLRLLIVAGGLVAALAAAAAATALTRRALRPLERLTTAAAGIEATGDPSRRLPAAASGDEVGALSQTLNRMLAALERAQERERRFVADASHELRTPLTALRGNADFLARHGADDPAALEDLRGDAERLSRLVDDLLALAREDAAPPPSEPVRLDELARRVAAADAGASVQPGEAAWVRGDQAALERALRNLVENARRHGPPGGAISVAVAQRDGRVEVSVSDEGRGLEVPLEQATQRFWRGASGSVEGSGLGLSLVAATAARHGGSLRAQGPTFTLALPPLKQLSDGGATTRPTTERKDLP